MSRVVGSVAGLLKDAEFRKRRHGFNRVAGVDLVQVVHFQRGSHLPPGATEIPPIRRNVYGKFTINLGVYVPDLARRLGRIPKGDWTHEYDCHLRQRIGQLLSQPADTWWSLDDPDAAAHTTERALRELALPWLDSVATKDEIFDTYERSGAVGVGLGLPAAPVPRPAGPGQRPRRAGRGPDS